MKRLFILFLVFSFSKLQAQIYRVKKGESLSGILYRNVAGRIYGPDNNLEKTLKLNPHIKNKNDILGGSEIVLPKGSGGKTQWELAQTKNNTPSKDLSNSIMSQTTNPNNTVVEKVKPSTESFTKVEITPSKDNQVVDSKKEIKRNLEAYLRIGMISQSIQATESSTGNSTNLVSENQMKYQLGLRQKLDDSSNLTLEFQSLSNSYSGSSSLTLTQPKQNLSGAQLIYERKNITSSLNLNAMLGYQGRVFVNSTGVNQIEFLKRTIPFLGLEMEYPLFRTKNNFEILSSFGYQYFLSTSSSDYNTEAGNMLNLKLISRYNFREHFFLNLGMEINSLNISSDYLKQSEKSYFLFTKLGVQF